jgi:secondary thiamine-phosphate synthase enzyme
MKSFRKELTIGISEKRGFVVITDQLRQALNDSGIKEGMLLCNSMNITTSVFVNDNEAGLLEDFESWLNNIAPEMPYSSGYKHNGFGDNADAHLKRCVMGREVVIAITNGNLDMGRWEQVLFGEFDGGKRTNTVLIKIIGE